MNKQFSFFSFSLSRVGCTFKFRSLFTPISFLSKKVNFYSIVRTTGKYNTGNPIANTYSLAPRFDNTTIVSIGITYRHAVERE